MGKRSKKMSVPATLFVAVAISNWKRVSGQGMVSMEQRIKEKIFKNYDPDVRPVKNDSTPVEIYLNQTLYSINEINEPEEFISFSQWEHMNWRDDYLTWDPKEFGGVSSIIVPTRKLWMPDVVIYGIIEVKNAVKLDESKSLIKASGMVYIANLQTLKVSCPFKVRNFPYDVQNCSIKYSSWLHGDHLLSLKEKGNESCLFSENTEWKLISYKAVRDLVYYDEKIFFSELTYFISLERKSQYYLLTLVVPCWIISALTIMGMFSPFNSEGERQEKVTLGLTCLLTMSILLLMVSEQMPKTSEGMPKLGLFIMFEIVTATVGTITATVIMYIHNSGVTKLRPVPLYLRKFSGMDREGGQTFTKNLKSTTKIGKVTEIEKTPQNESNSDEFSGRNLIEGKVSGKEAMSDAGLEQSNDCVQPCPLNQFICWFEKALETALREILDRLRDVQSEIDASSQESRLAVEWATVTARLDLLMLILFELFNLIGAICIMSS